MTRYRSLSLPLLVSLVTSGCAKGLEGPTPAPGSVDPGLVCAEQLTSPVTVRGTGFSPLPVDTLTGGARLEIPKLALIRGTGIDGAAASGPTVEIPDDARDPAASRVRWTSAEEMSFDVFPELLLEPGLHDVSVTNRTGLGATIAGALLAVPPPTVTSIEPDLLCGDKPNSLALNGDFFLRLAAGQPTVTLTDAAGNVTTHVPASMDGCRALPGQSGAEACTTLSISLPDAALPPGSYTIVLTNPAPAGCASSEPQSLTIVPRPTLAQIEPDLACLEDGAVSVTLTGTGFLGIDAATPEVRIGDQSYPATLVPASCSAVPAMRETVLSCTSLTAQVSQQALAAGVYPVIVMNPVPADCPTEEAVSWTVVPAPQIATLTPSTVCSDGTTETVVTVDGAAFLTIGAESPGVLVGALALTSTVDAASCTDVTGVSEATRSCTSLSFTVPAGALPAGVHDVVITNPAPAACSSSTTPAQLRFVGRPTITGVVPARVCSGGGTLQVLGTGFDDQATVTLAGTAATGVRVDDPTQLEASFAAGQIAGGPYDLVVSNAPGCEATLTGVVTVITGPQLFFADPPVVYSGISTQVLLYATGVLDTVQSVSLRLTGTQDAPTVVDSSWNLARPNRVQIVVPAGLPAGTYDVLLADTTECQATLDAGLVVTDSLTVTLTSVDAPFGWTSSDTAVTVTGAGFQAIPRLYLNPQNPGAATIATPLTSVTLLSPTSATAVVAGGLAIGSYDLIAVNPDGSVGLLPAAFSVTSLPPPTIATISPGTLANSAAETFQLFGADFRSPEVSLSCIDPAGGAGANLTATVSGVIGDTELTATFDASAVGGGGICIVRVTNPDEATYGEFSALVVTSPSQNLFAPVMGTDLLTARRAPAAEAGSITSAARFLYAIGGDGGAVASALDTVESAPVDIFGVPAAFVAQRYTLTTPRTFAEAARIGRFLYVAGGNDGTAPLATVERAYLLDPRDRVEITDLEITLVPAGGIAPGLYYYRVAALRDPLDAKNPGGEDLASEAFPVRLPAVAGRGLTLGLVWTLSPGATGYRIYRSPAAGDAAGSEQLLAEVAGEATTSFLDDGTLTPAGLSPLPIGSTGTWSVVATLAQARQAAGVVALATPVDPAVHTLYVAGGVASGTALTSIELLPITVAVDESQTVGAVRTSGSTLTVARSESGIYGVTNEISSRVLPGAPWVYVAGGRDQGGGATGDVDAFAVLPDGELDPAEVVGSMTPARAGFGRAVAANFLNAFGGQGGGASRGIASAEECGVGNSCNGGPDDPPDLVNWNSAGVSLTVARVNMGTAVTSGTIYLLGGSDGAQALSSTERTSW